MWDSIRTQRLLRLGALAIASAFVCVQSMAGAPLCAQPKTWAGVVSELSSQQSWHEASLQIQKLTLRSDEKAQDALVTSRDDCGTSGCPYVIYGQDDDAHYCNLGEVSGFVEVLPAVHQGRHDLRVKTRLPTDHVDEVATDYHFDGKAYVESTK